MKRLSLIAIFLFSMLTTTLAASLKIRNITSCDISVTIGAHNPGGSCADFISAPFTMGYGTTISFMDINGLNCSSSTYYWVGCPTGVSTLGIWDYVDITFIGTSCSTVRLGACGTGAVLTTHQVCCGADQCYFWQVDAMTGDITVTVIPC